MAVFQSENQLVVLAEEPLNVKQAFDFVILPWTGGTSCFLGTTRDTFENKKVTTLFYEAYTPMAMSELKRVCKLMQDRFDVENVCLMHRLGEVSVTQTSVIVVASAKHRKSAIEAAEFGINEIKARVPIWKKEIYEDTSSEWKENKEVFWKN